MNDLVSRHALILPFVDDKFILFNGLYGAVDVIDQRTADIIRDAQLSNTQPIELDNDMHDRLVRRGHLIDRQTEAEDLKILSRMMLHLVDRNHISLIIMPTYNCNFRCTYCFERHRLTRGKDWLEHVMSPSIVDAVFNQMNIYRAKGHRFLGCTLHGGEPFLASNIDTVRNICEHCRAFGLPIVRVATNGYDLDAYFDLIEEFNIRMIEITLDGVGSMQDRRRPHLGGGSSYERIIKNISAALKRKIRIRIRINVDRQNINELGKLHNELKTLGFIDDPCFDYYFKSVHEGTTPDPAQALTEVDVFDKMREIGIDEREAITCEQMYSDHLNIVWCILDKKRYPMLNGKHCDAEGGMLFVDPHGYIYSCWGTCADENFAIGEVDELSGRFNFNFNMVKWRTRRVHNIEDCRECTHAMQCAGGCGVLALNQCGTLTSGHCDVFREVFNHVLTFKCREAWTAARSTELSKSWRELLSRFDDSDRQTLLKTRDPKQTFETWNKVSTLKEMFGTKG